MLLSHPSQEATEYEINRGVCEGYKRKSDMGYVRHLFQNSCLCFDQNTPGIYSFTPAFDEKTPAFGDTRNQTVFEKMNSYFYLLIFYLFLNLHILLLGQNNLS